MNETGREGRRAATVEVAAGEGGPGVATTEALPVEGLPAATSPPASGPTPRPRKRSAKESLHSDFAANERTDAPTAEEVREDAPRRLRRRRAEGPPDARGRHPGDVCRHQPLRALVRAHAQRPLTARIARSRCGPLLKSTAGSDEVARFWPPAGPARSRRTWSGRRSGAAVEGGPRAVTRERVGCATPAPPGQLNGVDDLAQGQRREASPGGGELRTSSRSGHSSSPHSCTSARSCPASASATGPRRR